VMPDAASFHGDKAMTAARLDDYPETLTFAQVRHVLGVDQAELRRMQKTGALPPTLKGCRRLSRDAIKASLRLDPHPSFERTIAAEELEILERIKSGAAHGKHRRVRALS
jgi:hypothetical protein